LLDNGSAHLFQAPRSNTFKSTLPSQILCNIHSPNRLNGHCRKNVRRKKLTRDKPTPNALDFKGRKMLGLELQADHKSSCVTPDDCRCQFLAEESGPLQVHAKVRLDECCTPVLCQPYPENLRPQECSHMRLNLDNGTHFSLGLHLVQSQTRKSLSTDNGAIHFLEL
jgi:hypothetical protein